MQAALQAAKFETPTPVQAAAIPPALEGRDLIGIAQTGTGKTAAFLVPIFERLREQQASPQPGCALVLAPTRELAEQIHQWAQRFGGSARSALVVGGVSYGPQYDALRRRPSLIIATPGRLVDHLERRTMSLSDVRIFVLDEADRMLDMGFKPQLDRIMAVLPKTRQTLLFSATMPSDLDAIVRMHLNSPVKISVGEQAIPPSQTDQDVYLVEQQQKTPLLLSLMGESNGTVLIFTRTKHRADRLAKTVRNAGHAVERLHSDRTQAQRRAALQGFKDGRYRILIATDIAARGIDVTGINHVVNFDLPHTAEDYVHRVGRTSRAGASGRATSFASADERNQLRAIERHIGKPLPRQAHDLARPEGAAPMALRPASADAPRRFTPSRFSKRNDDRPRVARYA